MTVKRCLNDTNYVLQKSAKSRPFIVRIDCMRQFPNELSKKERVLDPLKLPTAVDSSSHPLSLKPKIDAWNATGKPAKSG